MSRTATRTAYGLALAELVIENEKIVVLDADLSTSTKTCEARKVCAERFFNMGIAEANMMGTAAGLARSGYIPFVSSFAIFAAGRAFEQIRNSIAYPCLNVNICATHAGISVGEDGATHQAIEDLALMRAIPNMHVFQPCDAIETREMIRAAAQIDAPCYIRLGRSDVTDVNTEEYVFQQGKGVVLHQGKRVAILASGRMVQEALMAARELSDIDPTIVNIHTIKPIDQDLILQLATTHDLLVSVEEHTVIGGLGSAIAEVLSPHRYAPLIMIGIQDVFGESGTPDKLLMKYGLSALEIVRQIRCHL